MNTKPIEPGSGLDQAADELFNAWYKYREFVKRNHRDRLTGVMIVRRGLELILHSESERYSNQVMSLTYDPRSDLFSWNDAKYLED
jgi:hypothetical protein